MLQADIIRVPAEQPTIQAGIDMAVDGDTVLVADGTYTGNGNRDIDFNGKAIVVMSENGPDVTIIDCEGSYLDYHRGFYFHSGENESSVVQGFTIQNGYAYEDYWPQNAGGGILCSSSSPTIIDNTITENTVYGDGGGISCWDSSPIIRGNTITGNMCIDWGGGISCQTNSSPTITGNTITDNYGSSKGGGILCTSNSSPSITGNTITGNYAFWDGSGISCLDSSPTITGNTITANTVDYDGGGISCDDSSPIITGNTITGNMAQSRGGGIWCFSLSDPTITDNMISGNTANSDGGGVWCSTSSSPTITGNTITGNEGVGIVCEDDITINENAITYNNGSGIVCGLDMRIEGNTITGNNGSGISCRGYSTIVGNSIIGNNADQGGGILCADGPLSLYCNTIVENTANNGGGIYCSNSTMNITNSILYGNDAAEGEAIYLADYSALTINYSNVDGWLEGVYLDYGSLLYWDYGMMEVDPMFVLREKQDYRLLWGSLCIDTGYPDSTDADGTISDIGAHFYDQDEYITLYVTPDSTEIEPGGQLGVTFTVINRWFWEQPLWLQARVSTPGGGSRNVFEPIEYTMSADSTVQVHVNHDIPMAIPAGTYEYLSRIGIPPEMLYDSDSFRFIVNQ
jgi:parallel beta-helix repeat protein